MTLRSNSERYLDLEFDELVKEHWMLIKLLSLWNLSLNGYSERKKEALAIKVRVTKLVSAEDF